MVKKIFACYSIFLGSFFIVITGCQKDNSSPDPVTDVGGNKYKTVKIGSQIWMSENLKTIKYNDGTDIPLVADAMAWSKLKTPGYCWYTNDPASFKDTYGAIYNGYTVLTGKLCPEGWHIPQKNEWLLLREFLGDSAKSGGKVKEAGTTHWLVPNKGADNSSGFTALPAGFRYFEGTFSSILSFTCIWSDTEIEENELWYMGLYFADAAFIIDRRNKKHGFSVRCIKD